MNRQTPPVVVHECERCGATQTPDEAGQGVNISGMITCRVCGHVGPLRVQVKDGRKQLLNQRDPEIADS